MSSIAPFEAFYLPVADGERFCLFHRPAIQTQSAVLYLHPFAEEMNKCRRMAALQARALAIHGISVLQMDLFGCGDSSGDFGEARWEIWKQDASTAMQWIRRNTGASVIHLWGVRLGGMLALDVAAGSIENVGAFLLWQPVISGESFLTQFLRLRVATAFVGESAEKTTTRALRDELCAGRSIEVGGYELHPDMADSIERLSLKGLAPRGARIHWFEVTSSQARGMSPAAEAIARAWASAGVAVERTMVLGEPFWNTVEIAECPELLDQSTRALVGARQ